MLAQALIEIVDESGTTEDSVMIMGPGEISLGARDGTYLHVDRASPDIAVILQTGDQLSIQIKLDDAIRQDEDFLAIGPIVVPGNTEFIGFIQKLQRFVRVRSIMIEAALLTVNGVVFRTQRSRLQQLADRSIAVGRKQVTEQLARLRARQVIDARGNLLVPAPADMDPGSSTDL